MTTDKRKRWRIDRRVSVGECQVYLVMKRARGAWLRNRQIATRVGNCDPRMIRAHTSKLHKIGVLDCRTLDPQGTLAYRLRPRHAFAPVLTAAAEILAIAQPHQEQHA